MMVRKVLGVQEHMMLVLRISSTLALVLACALLVASGVRWVGRPSDGLTVRPYGAALGEERMIAEEGSGLSSPSSPLVVQAEAFARHLAGPESPAPVAPLEPSGAAPAPLLGLTLHATSYYPDQPRRSMALVSLTSAPQEEPRWVKEGTQIDIYRIHEIRPSLIVYRQGDELREAAVARPTGLPSLVRDLRAGSHPVGRASDARPIGPRYTNGLTADVNTVDIDNN